MAGHLDINCHIDFPEDCDNHVIQGILRRMNGKYRPLVKDTASSPIFWEEESFGLQSVTRFKRASLAQQKSILEGLSLMLLREAFAIERAGMAFASKMVLLSDDVDARILYSQFAAQEASHYQMIASHIHGEPRDLESDPFLFLLKDSIEQGDRMTLTFVIQIVLEGWGLLHYRKLQKECVRDELSQDLKQILLDEAHHHGSGVALFSEDKIEDKSHCLAVLQNLLGMVRVGPVGLLHEMQKVLGPFDAESRGTIMNELNHFEQSTQKLQQLRAIMKAGGASQLIEQLEASFAPLTEISYA